MKVYSARDRTGVPEGRLQKKGTCEELEGDAEGHDQVVIMI